MEKINSLGVAPRSVKDVKNKWSKMLQKAEKEIDLHFNLLDLPNTNGCYSSVVVFFLLLFFLFHFFY